VQTDYFRYRGVDSDMQMSVALANSGDVQLEQGTVIELSDISGPKGQFFQYLREVAADWTAATRSADGSEHRAGAVDLSRSGFRSVAGRGGWQEAGAWLTDRVHRGREWARDRPLW